MKSVGRDMGGTFTHLILINEETGEIFSNKVPSRPFDLSMGTLNGVIKICSLSSIKIQEIDQFHDETTVATNTIVEHQGTKGGVITTKGFRDIIQIAQQKKHLTYTVQIGPTRERNLKKKVRENGCRLISCMVEVNVIYNSLTKG